MEDLKLLPVLLLFLISTSGKLDYTESREDEYAKFKVTPEYIVHPTEVQKTYFDAYDKTLQHWGVDYEDLYINTSKGIAHVLVSGPRDGTPLVLLHGMGGSSTMWYPHAKVLSEEYRLFAIDLIIEPGKSYKTADFKNIDEINSWYQEIFDALKLDTFFVMGPSRGGWLAMNLALHSEGNIKGLILLSPVQTFVWVPPSAAVLKNILNIFYPKDRRIERTMETLSLDPSRIDKDFLEQYRIGKENDSVNKFVTQMRPFSHRDLKSLNIPVLVLIGDHDMLNNKRAIRLAEKYLPQGQGEIVSSSGHFISIDQTEVVNEKILDFLRRVDNGNM